jgi:hypothetical protein
LQLPIHIPLHHLAILAVSLIAAVIATTNALSANAQIVVAHFMAQNAFSYSPGDWANDINTAKATGIDGFGELYSLNLTYSMIDTNSVEYRSSGLRS